MKKFYYYLAGAIVLVASAVVFVHSRKSVDFIDANVEALAETEAGGFGPMCSKTGSSGTYRMKLCSDCSGSWGNYAMDVVAFCRN